jgi:hypothetical protein
MKLSPGEMDTLHNLCLDDSTRIIRYLEENQKKQKRYNTLILIITILGAIGSIAAAITGIILLF